MPGVAGPFQFQLILDSLRSLADVDAVLHAGVDCLHIRIRNVTTRKLLAYTQEVVRLAGEHRAVVLVNGRVDIALAAGASGVQLPAHGMPVALARHVTREMLLGRSVHSAAEIRELHHSRIDFVTFGHVFATDSHPGEAPRGPDALRDAVIAADGQFPVVAIGGIRPDRIAGVIQQGATAVAVIGAVWQADDPIDAVRDIRKRIDACISS